jgi:hypothetical protein
VIALVGQTRSRALVARLADLGIGEMTQPDEYPPRRTPFAMDNAVYKTWKAGLPFDGDGFMAAIERVAASDVKPLFVVAPDIVAGGDASLVFSLSWLERLRPVAPVYLVTQDGMSPAAVSGALFAFSGLFVGGSLPWKIRTGEEWVRLAHRHGKPCHIGRVGTPRRVKWAKRIGADSIDSCLPLWSTAQLNRFLAALANAQGELFREVA